MPDPTEIVGIPSEELVEEIKSTFEILEPAIGHVVGERLEIPSPIVIAIEVLQMKSDTPIDPSQSGEKPADAGAGGTGEGEKNPERVFHKPPD